jgi:hypothetical protein
METIKGIHIPVVADNVLDPEVYYGNKITGIYFQTEDDLFGRITFYNLDAIKVCRGEVMPYDYDWGTYESGTWIFKVENSKWLAERFKYESDNYGTSYEFNGNVNEMLTDFSHYCFLFHDQFVEVIARGFWFEKDAESLFGRELQDGHPLLPLPETGMEKITTHHLTCQIRINQTSIDQIIENSKFCPQKLFEFALELEGKASVSRTLKLILKEGKLISSLRGHFGELIAEFEGIAAIEQIKPYIEKYIAEVYERRKKMGK